MKAKFFSILMLLLVSSFSMLPGFAEAQVIGEQFTYTLEINDGMLVDGAILIGGNGVIEPGEHIRLKIILKNEGKTTVENVKGILSVKNNTVKIVDNTMKYGNIDPNRLSNPLDEYKFDVPSSLTSQVVTLTLTVTGDGNSPWTVPIKLNIINPEDIDILLPKDLITEVAVGKTSTYFILNAKYPTLTGPLGEKISYGSCTITLHIPNGTHPFIFPIKTKEEIAIDAGIEAVVSIVTLGNSNIVKVISYASSILDSLDLLFKLGDIGDRDLTVKLPNRIVDPERPKTEKEYLILLKNTRQTLHGIDITLKQEYQLGSPPATQARKEVERNSFWNFKNGWSAPAVQPVAISDYPPFYLLPPEVQEYLLVEFAEAGTPERWLIPDETVMDQNYPNPFNPETWIPYQLAKDSEVSITIYDATGTIVHSLPLGLKPAGYYTGKERAAYWDGRNTHGETLANGLYFYQLKTDKVSLLRKMVILK